MKTDQLATLTSLLTPYVALGNHRLQTLCLLITAMVSARTVNLSHLAAERASEVLVASTYRRLQRFFQYVRPLSVLNEFVPFVPIEFVSV